MYNVQCTVYSVLLAIYIEGRVCCVYLTEFSVLGNLQNTMHSIQSTLTLHRLFYFTVSPIIHFKIHAYENAAALTMKTRREGCVLCSIVVILMHRVLMSVRLNEKYVLT